MKVASPIRSLLIASAVLIAGCGKEKATALDITLDVTGALDQVRVDEVSLGGSPISLTGEQTLYPSSPRMLRSGNVLTLWFADSEDNKRVVVTATGRLCGRDASNQASTPERTLAKAQTVQTTLMLANNGVTCAGTGMGGMGGGGGGGGSGAGGTAGTIGTGGAAGTGGGSAGAGGTAGGAGVAGSVGAAGRGGTTGSAGTGGAAGRGGTTGTAGTAGTTGVAGRGGTTGTAGTTGLAGRGGTTGMAGATGVAGRGGSGGGGSGGGGTTGVGGMGNACATTPADAIVTPGPVGTSNLACGYPLAGAGVQYIWTPADYYARGNAITLGANGANCGRCVEFVYSPAGASVPPVTVTIVGSCDAASCPNQSQAAFSVSPAAFQVLSPASQQQIPRVGETLKYSFVPCPVPSDANGQPASIRASLVASGANSSVVFYAQRYGIASGLFTDANSQMIPIDLGLNNVWHPRNSIQFPQGTVAFSLTDVNNKTITFTMPSSSPTGAMVGAQFPVCTTP